MADPLTWAGGPRPTSESWVVENADRSGGPSLTGSEQIVSSVAGRWRAKLTFQRVREEILWLRALIMGLRGRAGTVLVGPFDLLGAPAADIEEPWALGLTLVGPQITLPIRTPSHAALTAAGSIMDRSISVDMLLNRAPQLGNYVGIGQRLHVITSISPGTDLTTYPHGYVLGIEPGLRDDIAAFTDVTFTAPLCLMRVMTPVDALTVSGGDHVTNVTLDLVESF